MILNLNDIQKVPMILEDINLLYWVRIFIAAHIDNVAKRARGFGNLTHLLQNAFAITFSKDSVANDTFFF